MTHASLWSGIDGFALAAQWVGWENVFSVEIDNYCDKVLTKRFYATRYRDGKQFSGLPYRGTIDVLSGGEPCQPHSVAGLGKGKDDVRFLWPDHFRILREIQPAWAVNENVSGSIANGILDLKISDLESVGYSCQPYCIPAESVGALHQRERVWLVAYNSDFDRNNKVTGTISGTEEKKRSLEGEQYKVYQPWEPVDLWFNSPNTDLERLKKQHTSGQSRKFNEGLSGYFGFGPAPHGNIPRNIIESGIIRMLDGLPEGMDYANRNQRIKALGNSIVPQVAYEIFKAIETLNAE